MLKHQKHLTTLCNNNVLRLSESLGKQKKKLNSAPLVFCQQLIVIMIVTSSPSTLGRAMRTRPSTSGIRPSVGLFDRPKKTEKTAIEKCEKGKVVEKEKTYWKRKRGTGKGKDVLEKEKTLYK